MQLGGIRVIKKLAVGEGNGFGLAINLKEMRDVVGVLRCDPGAVDTCGFADEWCAEKPLVFSERRLRTGRFLHPKLPCPPIGGFSLGLPMCTNRRVEM